jgi:hypothetical protein
VGRQQTRSHSPGKERDKAMYATVTIHNTGLIKEEIMEVIDYHSTKFWALREKGPFVLVRLRSGEELPVWADEITITP